jgi:YD repeat-containing protein
MRTITLAAVLALLAGAAATQPSTTFHNERGQITGSSSTSGNVTTFRDRSGRMTGTAAMAACSIVTLWAGSQARRGRRGIKRARRTIR